MLFADYLFYNSRPMKILLTGKTGQVGGELNSILKDMGELVSVGREQLDLSKIDSIEPAVLAVSYTHLTLPTIYSV